MFNKNQTWTKVKHVEAFQRLQQLQKKVKHIFLISYESECGIFSILKIESVIQKRQPAHNENPRAWNHDAREASRNSMAGKNVRTLETIRKTSQGNNVAACIHKGSELWEVPSGNRSLSNQSNNFEHPFQKILSEKPKRGFEVIKIQNIRRKFRIRFTYSLSKKV